MPKSPLVYYPGLLSQFGVAPSSAETQSMSTAAFALRVMDVFVAQHCTEQAQREDVLAQLTLGFVSEADATTAILHSVQYPADPEAPLAESRTDCLERALAFLIGALLRVIEHLDEPNGAGSSVPGSPRRAALQSFRVASRSNATSPNVSAKSSVIIPPTPPMGKAVVRLPSRPAVHRPATELADTAMLQSVEDDVDLPVLATTMQPPELHLTVAGVNDYIIERCLGRSWHRGDRAVYAAKVKGEATARFALKMVPRPLGMLDRCSFSVSPPPSSDEDRLRLARRQHIEGEVMAMKECLHPNIVSLLDVIDDVANDRFVMVHDYFARGPILPPGTTATAPCSPEFVARVAYDVSNALQYLHLRGLIHGNVKPENLFVTNDGHVQLSDAGFILDLLSPPTVSFASAAFVAPELMSGGSLSTSSTAGNPTASSSSSGALANWEAVDAYALGATLHLLRRGALPLSAADDEDAVGQEPLPPSAPRSPQNAARSPRSASKLPPGVELAAALDVLIPSLLEPDPRQRCRIDTVMARLGPFIALDGPGPSNSLGSSFASVKFKSQSYRAESPSMGCAYCGTCPISAARPSPPPPPPSS